MDLNISVFYIGHEKFRDHDLKHVLNFRDIGVIDKEGYCTISGRIKDIIIRGGENINPLEVEQVIYTHPKIKDVQVSQSTILPLVNYSIIVKRTSSFFV